MKTKIILSLLSSTMMFAASTQAPLSPKEQHSLELAQEWIDKDIKSFTGKDGAVNFIFGATMPSVVSAPLRITDIQLEPGEYIKDVQVGDAVRWQLSTSISGSGDALVSHIIVKPIDPNIETTLMISTDRRVYHLNLTSKKNEYMPIVGFTFPSDLKKSLTKYHEELAQIKSQKQFEVKPGETPSYGNIDSLSFDYRLSGDNPSWKPIRVYNDGIKTYIQMPKTMLFNEAPVLMVLDSSGDKQMVNYRLLEDRFVVDKLFDKAVLFMDIGGNQEAVIIENKSPNLTTNEKNTISLNSITKGPSQK